jgi:broad specificity phosphatase PhoE
MRNRSEIVLARHGRPLMKDVSPIAGAALGAWVRRYDNCGVDRSLPPPEQLRQLATAAGRILSSNLPRSIESAAWLSSGAEIEPGLQEAGLPDCISIPIRLRPAICVVLARLSWWMNWSTSAETIGDARARAGRAAERLCELAQAHSPVLVVGHGMFNRFVADCLRERGWRGPRMLPSAYWSTARFIQNL